MNRFFKTILACALMVAMLAGTVAAFADCAHTDKKEVTVKQDPVYTSEGASGHRVTVDTMIYWECTSCGERFSGKPGESTSTTEPHDLKDNVCTKCGYKIEDKALDKVKGNGTTTMNVGAQIQLRPAFASANGWKVTGYKSSKPKVASVSDSGVVTALSEGRAKITISAVDARNKKKKATLSLKVVDPYKPTGVKILQGKSATVDLGSTLQLTASLTPVTAKTTLTWTSKKPSIASVDANGVVTPHAEGKTKITVKTGGKKQKKATITIKVVDPKKPTGIKLQDGKSVILKVGQTLKLTPVLTPTTAETTLTWSSKKASVATVAADGTVTAVKPGTTRVSVWTSSKKKKKASIIVYVID